MAKSKGPFWSMIPLMFLAVILLVAGTTCAIAGGIHAITQDGASPGIFFLCWIPIIFAACDFFICLKRKTQTRTFLVSVVVTVGALLVLIYFAKAGTFSLGLVMLAVSLFIYWEADQKG